MRHQVLTSREIVWFIGLLLLAIGVIGIAVIEPQLRKWFSYIVPSDPAARRRAIVREVLAILVLAGLALMILFHGDPPQGPPLGM